MNHPPPPTHTQKCANVEKIYILSLSNNKQKKRAHFWTGGRHTPFLELERAFNTGPEK